MIQFNRIFGRATNKRVAHETEHPVKGTHIGKKALLCALMLAGMGQLAHAMAVYDATTRVLTIPLVSAPGLGSFSAQLSNTSADPNLSASSSLKLLQLTPTTNLVEVPATYRASDQTVFLAAVAVRGL
ncbi:MAG: hypothetical protein ABIZ09_03260, partial [Rhodoferax sp.]